MWRCCCLLARLVSGVAAPVSGLCYPATGHKSRLRVICVCPPDNIAGYLGVEDDEEGVNAKVVEMSCT